MSYINEYHEFLVEDQLHDIEAKIEWLKKRMISSMDSLKDMLEREMKGLKEDSKHTPNSLGVLQGNAGQVDIMCMEYSQLLDQKKRLERIISKYEKLAQDG